MSGDGSSRRRTPRRTARWALLGILLLLLAAAGWGLLHRRYQSWHPCDWLLVDRVAVILRRQGVDPDTVSIPLKATVAESAEVRAVLRLRHTPAQCLITWAAARVLP